MRDLDFKTHYHTHRASYLLLALLVLVVLGWGIVETVQFHVAGRGTVEIRDIPAGTIVQIDERTVEHVESGTSTIRTDLSPSEHTITTIQERSWPWAKTLSITRDTLTVVTPFMISRSSVAQVLGADHPERAEVERLFADTTRPTKNNPLYSDDQTVALWIDGGNIVVRWEAGTTTLPHFFCADTCLPERTVLHAIEPITYADFLAGRNDVIVLASSQGISALELDTRGTQNFHPISDKNGTFRIRDATSLYAHTGTRFFIIPL